MTLSFTHIVWIVVLAISSFMAGWLLRRIRAVSRELAQDLALRDALERLGTLDADRADRHQHLALLKRNLETESAAVKSLEAALRRKSAETTSHRQALLEARAELKALAAAGGRQPPRGGDGDVSDSVVADTLTQALAERDRRILGLEVDLAQRDGALHTLAHELHEARERAAAHLAADEERERGAQALREEIDKWRARVPKLAETLKARDATVAERERTIETLEASLAEQHRALDAVRATQHERDLRAGALTEELSAARGDLERARAAFTLRDQAALAHEQRAEAAVREVEAMRAAQQTLAAERDALTATLAEHERESDAIGATIAALEAERDGNALKLEAVERRERDDRENREGLAHRLRVSLDETEKLRAELQQAQSRAAPMQETLARRDAEVAERANRIDALQTQLERLDATLQQRTDRVSTLERELAQAAPGEDTDLRGDYLEKRLIGQMEKNHEIVRQMQEREHQIASFARDKSLQEKTLGVLTQQLEDARAENARLAERLGEPPRADRSQGGSADVQAEDDDEEADSWQRPDGADNLQAVRGIGRSFEKRLNELGVTLLSQIVNLDEEEIARLENELGMFKGRIDRDDWIGQAAALISAAGDFERPLPVESEPWREASNAGR